MTSGFNGGDWFHALQSGYVRDCDAMLESKAQYLTLGDLDELQDKALDLFVLQTANDGAVLEPLLGLQSVLLQKGDFIGKGLAQSDAASWAYESFLQQREDNNRWRQIVARLLLGRARGTEPWESLTGSIKLLIQDPSEPRLSTSREADKDAWYPIKQVLDQYELEHVLLNEQQEKGIHQYAYRYLSAITGGDRGLSRGTPSAQASKLERELARATPAPLPGQGASKERPPAGPPTASLKRTPHMDVPDGPVPTDTDFEIQIYSDKSLAKPGEQSAQMSLDLPESIDEAEVQAWLSCSSHFEVVSSPIAFLRVRKDQERSANTLTFTLRAKSDAGEAVGDTGRITALFSYQGAPAGKVTREVRIARPTVGVSPRTTIADVAAGRAAHAQLVVGPRRRPDLEVRITRHPDGFPWKFNCSVSGPNTMESVAVWNMPGQAEPGRFVANSLEQFCSTKVTADQAPDLLRGVGKTLFRAVPENLKVAYWRLVDEGRPPETIAINSEEAAFPWELVVPHRTLPNSEPETREPLGVGSVVGRWVNSDGQPAPQVCTLSDSYIVAPSYPNPLTFAASESQYVRREFKGTILTPATYAGLTKALDARSVSLLHFACHGRSDVEKGQYIVLDNKEEMYAAAASGSLEFAKAFAGRPLVFLNACEVGRQQPALASPHGFASVFADLGACAVIAAVWSVEDDVAGEVAQTIYGMIVQGGDVPIASVLQKLRAKSYNKPGKDSYAAYCFYGDPLLVVRNGSGNDAHSS